MNREQRKTYAGWLKKGIVVECGLVLMVAAVLYGKSREPAAQPGLSTKTLSIEDDYIKWVDFTVSYEALCKAYEWDVETHGSEHEIDWVKLLAYTAAKRGGEFDKDALKTMDKVAEKLSEGETTMEELTEDLKYYSYYLEAYDAAIGGLVGVYWEEDMGAKTASGSSVNWTENTGSGDQNSNYADGNRDGSGADEGGNRIGGSGADEGVSRTGGSGDGETKGGLSGGRNEIGGDTSSEDSNGESGGETYVERYGLKGYFPLARGFDYTHYDDFGVSRSYGYKRQHLG